MSGDLERTAGGRDPWSERLSEYLDGELKGADRARFEEHLTTCVACATTLAELREVVSRAQALEDAPPARDLWPAIEVQLEPRARATRVRERSVVDMPSWWARRFDLGLPQLAAAGLLLIGLSATAVWVVLRGVSPLTAPITSVSAPAVRSTPPGSMAASPPPSAPTGRGERAVTGAPVATDAADATVATALANPRYDAAVAELERALAEGRGRLDPRTLRVVEENLKIIDRALEEARQAVVADPGNTWLRSHLASTMQRKVDLLRSATLLASVQG